MKKHMVLIIIFLCVAIIFGIVLATGKTTDQEKTAAPISQLEINGKKINLEVADTDAKRVLGLSNRQSLPEDTALLFVFPVADSWGIWMKDMNFPIDIMWLDADYRVVYSAANVSPDSYPQVFQSPTPARYVLEANAGFIAKHRIVYLEQLKIK